MQSSRLSGGTLHVLDVAAQSSLRSDCAATGKGLRYALRHSALLRPPSLNGRSDCAEHCVDAHSEDSGFQKFFRLRRKKFPETSAPERRRPLPVSGHWKKTSIFDKITRLRRTNLFRTANSKKLWKSRISYRFIAKFKKYIFIINKYLLFFNKLILSLRHQF